MSHIQTAKIEELLFTWEEMHDRGQEVSAESLCVSCPELIGTLQQRIQQLKAMDSVLNCHTEPREAEASLPDILGYEILGEVGHGGMGVVYRARQQTPDRIVAIKMLLGGYHSNPMEIARFRRETATIAGLRHPHLITVYEVGDAADHPFCSMEYISGGSLSQWTQGRPQPPRRVAELVRTLAEAIHVVHTHGIVHRDLKPSNILMDLPEMPEERTNAVQAKKNGVRCDLPYGAIPKITDFGLARKFDGSDELTVSGEILGSPNYMAPEQARGEIKRIGPATDVYGLGVILYELLTGYPPFEADTPWKTLQRVANEEPASLRSVVSSVSRDLQTICLKCLEKEPSRRYASAAMLAEDLRRFLANEPISARPLGWVGRSVKWVRRHPTATGILSVLFMATITFAIGAMHHATSLAQALHATQIQAEESRQRLVRLLVDRGTRLLDEGDWFRSLPWFVEALRLDTTHPEAESMHRTRIASVLQLGPKLARLWFHEGPVACIRFAPNNRRFASASADGLVKIWSCESDKSQDISLSHSGAVHDIRFSPDGESLVTACDDGNARLWSLTTGELHFPPFKHDGPVNSVAFSPDGTTVASASDDGTVCLWNTLDGRRQGQPLRHDAPVRKITFSHDGKLIATACDDGKSRIWIVKTTSLAVPPLEQDGVVFDVAFSPDDNRIVTASADKTARIWDVINGKCLQTLQHGLAVVNATFSPDGRIVATASDDHTACLWNFHNDNHSVWTLSHRSSVNVVAFSEDGLWVGTGADDNTARIWSVTNGKMLPPSLPHGGSVNDIAISPDGRWVATASNDHAVRVWEISEPTMSTANGVEEAMPVRSTPQLQWPSPDGRLVAVLKGDLSVYVCSAVSGKSLGPPLKQSSQVVYVAFSRDGRWVVTAGDNNRAYLWDWASGELIATPLRHQGTVRYAAFSNDGCRIVTACADHSLCVWNTATGEPLTPQLQCFRPTSQIAFSPDGNSVTISFSNAPSRVISLLPDNRSVEQLKTVAELLASGYIHPFHDFLPFDPEQLQSADSIYLQSH